MTPSCATLDPFPERAPDFTVPYPMVIHLSRAFGKLESCRVFQIVLQVPKARVLNIFDSVYDFSLPIFGLARSDICPFRDHFQ